jgi:membrane associated rhomboid family serine protease
MSHDTSSNPILSAYETYFTSTPLVTRLILNTATVCYILSYFIDTNQILSCIPSQAILHLQFYRFFSSPFLCDGLIALLFSYISLLQHGVRLELSMGSTNIAAMVLALSLMPSVLFSTFAILTHNSFLMSVPFGGIWNIVFTVVAVECSFAPRGETRRFCMVDVQTRYYPCVFLGLVILFSGGTFPYAYILSVIAGYLYGFGKLDFFKMGWERRKELETNGLLRTFTSMQGFTPGPSMDSWTMIDRTGGILGVWNTSSSTSSGGPDTNESRSNNQQVRI